MTGSGLLDIMIIDVVGEGPGVGGTLSGGTLLVINVIGITATVING